VELAAGRIAAAVETVKKARGIPGYERAPEALELWARIGAMGRPASLTAAWPVKTLRGHMDYVNFLEVAANGRRAVSGSSDRTLKLWDIAEGTCVETIETDSPVSHVCVSENGNVVHAASSFHVRRWDFSLKQCTKEYEISTRASIESLALLSDVGLLAAGTRDGAVVCWDINGRQIGTTIKCHKGSVNGVAISPDGRVVLSGGADGCMVVSDPCTGTAMQSWKAHDDEITCLAISSDGRFAMSGGTDRCVRTWSTREWTELKRVVEGYDAVTSVAFLDQAPFGLSGRWGKQVQVLDLAAGTCLWRLEGHRKPVTSVGFALDGRLAMSASWDGTIRLWGLDWEYEFSEA